MNNDPSIVKSEEKLYANVHSNSLVEHIPASVYRLQLNKDFAFKDVREIISYLKKLGISAVYTSPFFVATTGSMHGYNVEDPTCLNSELGGKEEYEKFCKSLKENDLKQLIDIVPNHMGISGGKNKWWLDVLENGQASLYSHFFDIDWDPTKEELKEKILLPVLGDHYGQALDKGELKLVYKDGCLFVNYFSSNFPVAPDTYPIVLEYCVHELKEASLEYQSIITALKNLPSRNETSLSKKEIRSREKEHAQQRLKSLSEKSEEINKFIQSRLKVFNGNKDKLKSYDLLDHLLSKQSYRLAFWRVASEEINYRRFFDINELAAIKIENQSVFNAYHELIFKLIEEGKVIGLRIDHPDGLYNPKEYFDRLQERFQSIQKPPYIIIEKILEREESIPENWNVNGTVGYEFMNTLNGLFIKQENEQEFDRLYDNFIGHKIDFENLLYEKKKFFALVNMTSEINALGHRLDKISESNRKYRDFTRNNLTLAIRETIACFPVYRTYVSPDDMSISERESQYISNAINQAKRKTPALNLEVYDFLHDVLTLKILPKLDDEEKQYYIDFVCRFQQLTGPIMAKGLEDTSFYVYNRLVSLNEVGGDPSKFGRSPDEFHKENMERQKKWTYSLISSSTHDTKRSEDVRSRINVLSEMPDEWEKSITRWSLVNKKHKTGNNGVLEPRQNTEYFIYQTLLGAWPLESLDENSKQSFKERIWNYVLKSIREAKIYTSWTSPDKEYENAVKKFLDNMLNEDSFINDFLLLQEKISRFGMLNSLSSLILKIGSPGVVDTYQGNEIWNYSLVDPDNRRQVDYKKRQTLINELNGFSQDLTNNMQNGKIKMYLLQQGLNFRKQHLKLFTEGAYVPLQVEGNLKNNIIAFMRKHKQEVAIVVATRFFSELCAEEYNWKDTRIIVPDCQIDNLHDIFTKEKKTLIKTPDHTCLFAKEVFKFNSVGIITNANR